MPRGFPSLLASTLWNLESGQRQAFSAATYVWFLARGSFLAWESSADRTLHIWDVKAERGVGKSLPSPVGTSWYFAPDGTEAISAQSGKRVFAASTGSPQRL